MSQIRLGLYYNLDVSIYANPKYSKKKMDKIYLSLLTGTFKPSFSIKIKNLFKVTKNARFN